MPLEYILDHVLPVCDYLSLSVAENLTLAILLTVRGKEFIYSMHTLLWFLQVIEF